MKSISTLIILIILTVCNLNSKTYWEVIFEPEKEIYQYANYDLESFSKDTFILIDYFTGPGSEKFESKSRVRLSTNRGTDWETVYTYDNSNFDKFFKLMYLHINEDNIIYSVQEYGYLLYSKDIGKTWDSTYIANTKDITGAYRSFYSNNLLVNHFVEDNQIALVDLKTFDINWISLENSELFQNTTRPIRLIGIIGEDKVYFTLEDKKTSLEGSYFIYTTDNGETWNNILLERQIYNLNFIDENLGYAAGIEYVEDPQEEIRYGTIDKTTDGGKTWINIFKSEMRDEAINNLYSLDDELIALTSEGNILRSDNEFKTWKSDSVTNDIKQGSCNPREISCDDLNTCIIICYGDYILRSIELPNYVSEENNEIKYNYIQVFNTLGSFIGRYNTKEEALNSLDNGMYLIYYHNSNHEINSVDKLIIGN